MIHDREKCTLCSEEAVCFFTDSRSGHRYFQCECCDLRFLDPKSRLSAQGEFDRYLMHENDVSDPKYQNFVRPLYELIKQNISSTSKGLDFGCGSGPVLSHLLSADGYDINLYDPYFKPDHSALQGQYDFVFSVEVAEHFYNPCEEFSRLKELTVPNGHLMFMTLMYSQDIHFSSWPYRLDPTHVSFYSSRTFEWVKEKFDFKACRCFGNRIAWFECP